MTRLLLGQCTPCEKLHSVSRLGGRMVFDSCSFELSRLEMYAGFSSTSAHCAVSADPALLTAFICCARHHEKLAGSAQNVPSLGSCTYNSKMRSHSMKWMSYPFDPSTSRPACRAGVFGMNLLSGWEEWPHAFWTVTGGIYGCIALTIASTVAVSRRSKLL